jgi:hypothetical protein
VVRRQAPTAIQNQNNTLKPTPTISPNDTPPPSSASVPPSTDATNMSPARAATTPLSMTLADVRKSPAVDRATLARQPCDEATGQGFDS